MPGSASSLLASIGKTNAETKQKEAKLKEEQKSAEQKSAIDLNFPNPADTAARLRDLKAQKEAAYQKGEEFSYSPTHYTERVPEPIPEQIVESYTLEPRNYYRKAPAKNVILKKGKDFVIEREEGRTARKNFMFPPSIDEAFKAEANALGVSQNELINALLKQRYFDNDDES